MIIKKLFFLVFALLLTSCGGIQFVYNDSSNLTNPLYKKTTYEFHGEEIPSVYQNAVKYLGSTEKPKYKLRIEVFEEKTKRSVEQNQAISRLDYKIKFNYKLTEILENCSVYEKDIYSRFSYVPKSSGYNYGSDTSLDNMYELASEENLLEFINKVASADLTVCDNEN